MGDTNRAAIRPALVDEGSNDMATSAAITYLIVTVDRVDASGRKFQSTIHIGDDGYSQSGESLGDTVDLARALFNAAADMLNNDSDDDD